MSTNTNKGLEPAFIQNNNNAIVLVRDGKPVFENIGPINPFDFFSKEFIPGQMNHIKHPTLKIPGSIFGKYPNHIDVMNHGKHPFNFNHLRNAKHPYVKYVKKTSHFCGNSHKDPKFAELLKHLQETATEVKVEGDETIYITESTVVEEGGSGDDIIKNALKETFESLNYDQRPKMTKIDEATASKIQEFIKNKSFAELAEFLNEFHKEEFEKFRHRFQSKEFINKVNKLRKEGFLNNKFHKGNNQNTKSRL
ncbi:hypothetical protein RhiirA5_408081 [Rhizophagus irregularis]|uniref:Uncharacterized protein n=1 Tax=Rhizophagus irregularis TaxID=588596 RepID=A0A2I1ES80_9GLOM|nr:hypothetical protein RhiirA5_408081 [Rhizophagus irregularis]PKY24976.1 hypothetical protein RhiirB3_439736 [Rhizophagus irregularis]CAB4482959.1 unnamed protein product [Rhizophagus irregularis]CAB5217594.1 unnamed protein product [Rhizophagus irregularis]CAB5365476.1 unnamed protein product [Rhizophagus irregularis]